jgi:hypothetical protein
MLAETWDLDPWKIRPAAVVEREEIVDKFVDPAVILDISLILLPYSIYPEVPFSSQSPGAVPSAAIDAPFNSLSEHLDNKLGGVDTVVDDPGVGHISDVLDIPFAPIKHPWSSKWESLSLFRTGRQRIFPVCGSLFYLKQCQSLWRVHWIDDGGIKACFSVEGFNDNVF